MNDRGSDKDGHAKVACPFDNKNADAGKWPKLKAILHRDDLHTFAHAS